MRKTLSVLADLQTLGRLVVNCSYLVTAVSWSERQNHQGAQYLSVWIWLAKNRKRDAWDRTLLTAARLKTPEGNFRSE
jgi:hypothetical protein